uniref:Ig-like domain-containing protein n=1 Tax=Eptatretus burgeri TaxID=7764 RepID=A0A8C4WVB9_EPTBU
MESHQPWSAFLVLSLCAIHFCRGSDLITAEKDVSAFDGKTAVLKCSYNGSRDINSVKWTNKSSNDLIAERSRVDHLSASRIKFVESSGKTNGSIIIDPVHMWDTGTYKCGYDVQGRIPLEKFITLNVKEDDTVKPDSTSLWKIVIPIVVIGLLLSIAGIVFFLYKKGHLRKAFR